MTEQALAEGVGHPGMYRTVYSGMDVEAFLNPPRPRAEVRRELGLAENEVAFGTVARLFERKGHDDILAAAPAVLEANPNVRFVFIGDGILREKLVAETERLGLRHAFHFVGLVPPGRIPELLGALDAVVHPSLREGLARVLPQALLVGRPAISYDVDGAREVVLPETGVLLPPRDIPGLTAAVLRLAADPDLRRAMGEEGRRRFTDQFRHETMTRQLRLLSEELLAARPGEALVERGGRS
jgi:glycosyltransferase involved in cell wall biosynthesis